jgi:hypothetical protein
MEVFDMYRRMAIISLVLMCAICQNARSDDDMPSFAEVTQTVMKNFQKQPGVSSEAIISQGQVKPIFGQLKRMGWVVAEEKEILASVLPDNDFIVVQLRSSSGKKFMGRIENYPDAYDRLERLSRLAHGRQTVCDLIRGPDGFKMIEYMTTADGGIELGKMLSKDPQGAGFNEPTGRIYTASMLLERLKKAYAAATKKAKPQSVIGTL